MISKKFTKINVPNCIACKYFDNGKCNKYEHKINKNINYITETKSSCIIARKYKYMCGINGKGFESNVNNKILDCNINIFKNISCASLGFPFTFILINNGIIEPNLFYIFALIGSYQFYFINNIFYLLNKKKELKKIPEKVEMLIYDE